MRDRCGLFTLTLFEAACLLVAMTPRAGAQQPPATAKPAAESDKPEVADFEIDKSLDPRGRPDVDSLLEADMRYYVWYSGDEWHLRTTTSKFPRLFEGVVRIKDGKFTKCRPIGAESRDDVWSISEARDKLEFRVKTQKKFDGFDFKISGQDAVVQFELKTATKFRPKSIFLGSKLKHPRQAKFSLSADPQ